MTLSRMTVLGVLVCGAASAAIAQPTEDPLKGPAVKDNGVPGQKRSFGEGEMGRRAQAQRPLPIAAVNKALDVLRGDAAGDHKLSADQESKIKAVVEAFQSETRAYFEKHKDEIASLRDQVPAAERARIDRAVREFAPAARPSRSGRKERTEKNEQPAMDSNPAEKQADSTESTKARQRLQEILAGRPKAEDAHAKAWAVLTDAQKPLVEKEMARLREQAQKPAGAKSAPADASKPDALVEALKDKSAEEIMNDPRVPERLRERLRGMTPEQREQAITRLRERGARGLRRDDATEKPAPSSDDVRVPGTPK